MCMSRKVLSRHVTPSPYLDLSTWSCTGGTGPLSAMPVLHSADSFIMRDHVDVSLLLKLISSLKTPLCLVINACGLGKCFPESH